MDPARGLDPDAAEKLFTLHGPNRLPDPPRRSELAKFSEQLFDPLVLTLLGGAIVAAVLGASETAPGGWLARYGNACAIFAIVAINALLGYLPQRRAESALAALSRLVSPVARVRRAGAVVTIPSHQVVPGDVLELSSGDAVVADARVIESVGMATMEAALTGESAPCSKDAQAQVEPSAPVGDRLTMVFAGTIMVRGKGLAVVTATGPETELGRIGVMLRDIERQKTPLELRLESFGRIVLAVCLGLAGALLVWGRWHGGRPWSELALEAVALAVAAIPEGLPAITTITLALGVQRMARRGAIVRRLPAVETLGVATVICTDKTGTLTQNQMTVREVQAGGKLFRVTGDGYGPEGQIEAPDGARLETLPPALARLVESAVQCNNSRLKESQSGAWGV